MGNPKAFLTIHRQEAGYRPVHERIDDFSEVEQTLNSSDRRTQASRCMDCGVPFCHWACPLGNKQPEWQDLLYKGRWREAFHVLEQTCDFPEFTGRICPALCEKSCVLKLSCDEPVTIRENEASIVEAAFREGYIQPVRPIRNGKRVAVIGSGPAGLTAANQLNRRGYEVTVFEKYELPGGLLRFGIPNFKLGKNIIDRRIRLMEQEGIVFKVNTMVGNEVSAKEIASTFDAVCIAIGSEVPRDLPIEGRNLKGVHFALELLSQQNRILEGIVIPPKDIINCKGKKILVIGGGDTGSDCVGTANRHKAANVTQIEIMPQQPRRRMHPPLEPRLRPFHRRKEHTERRRSRRGGMVACEKRRTSRNVEDRPYGNNRSRPRLHRDGLHPPRTGRADQRTFHRRRHTRQHRRRSGYQPDSRHQYLRLRRCRQRCQPRCPCHGLRSQSSSHYRQIPAPP